MKLCTDEAYDINSNKKWLVNEMSKRSNRKAKLKKMSFQERKPKAMKWVAEFDESKGNIIKRYRKTFKVDRLKAVDELQKLGVKLTKEQIDKEKRSVEVHKKQELNKKKKRKERKFQKQQQEIFDDFQDDQFFFIAGYTSGGAPYGVTWEEMGLLPYEEYDDEVL